MLFKFSSQNRGFQGFGDRPAFLYSIPNVFLRNTSFFGPLANCHRFSVMREIMISACIEHLFFSGGPSAIRRFIVTIGINPVKRHSDFWLPQVSKEIRKIQPTLTNRNAFSSIIFKRRAFRIGTSLFDPKPNAMKFCSAFPVSGIGGVHDMRPCRATSRPNAPARNYFSVSEVISPNFLLIAASALTQKIRSTFRGSLKNSKVSKNAPYLGRVGFFAWHKYLPFTSYYTSTIKGLQHGF